MAHNIDTQRVDNPLRGTKIIVTAVEMESEFGKVSLEITAVRVPVGTMGTPPDPLDIPEDFRIALQEWLDVGNEVR